MQADAGGVNAQLFARGKAAVRFEYVSSATPPVQMRSGQHCFGLRLHAPAIDGVGLDGTKENVLDN